MTPRTQPAQNVIEVRGARQNNLDGVDIDVPKRALVVFTGVSETVTGQVTGRSTTTSSAL